MDAKCCASIKNIGHKRTCNSVGAQTTCLHSICAGTGISRLYRVQSGRGGEFGKFRSQVWSRRDYRESRRCSVAVCGARRAQIAGHSPTDQFSSFESKRDPAANERDTRNKPGRSPASDESNRATLARHESRPPKAGAGVPTGAGPALHVQLDLAWLRTAAGP